MSCCGLRSACSAGSKTHTMLPLGLVVLVASVAAVAGGDAVDSDDTVEPTAVPSM